MKYIKIRAKDKEKAKKLETAIEYMMDKQGITNDIKELMKLLYKFELVYGINLELKVHEEHKE